jgi:TonB family protein
MARSPLFAMLAVALLHATNFTNHSLIAQTTSMPPSSPQGSDNRIYKIGGDVSAPTWLSSAKSDSPEGNKNVKESGSVMVELCVEKDGSTSNIRVIQVTNSNGNSTAQKKELGEKAIEIVKHSTFKPAMRKGQPVRVAMTIEIHAQVF